MIELYEYTLHLSLTANPNPNAIMISSQGPRQRAATTIRNCTKETELLCS